MNPPGIFAQADLQDLAMPLFWTILVLMAVIIGAAIIMKMAGRWANARADEFSTSSGLLAHFRLLYERGECTREEFDQIRAKLGKRIREETNVPAEEETPPAGADQSADKEQMRLPDERSEPTIGPANESTDEGVNNSIQQ